MTSHTIGRRARGWALAAVLLLVAGCAKPQKDVDGQALVDASRTGDLATAS